MVKIDIELDPHLIIAMLEMVQAANSAMRNRLLVDPQLPDDDQELQEAWEEALIESLKGDCQVLQNLLQSNQFGQGELRIDDDTAEGVLRACSVIRLKLRMTGLRELSDTALENGEIDILELPMDQQRCFACYIFLAHLQSLILHELDPEA
jgi:hypothetical protein